MFTCTWISPKSECVQSQTCKLVIAKAVPEIERSYMIFIFFLIILHIPQTATKSALSWSQAPGHITPDSRRRAKWWKASGQTHSCPAEMQPPLPQLGSLPPPCGQQRRLWSPSLTPLSRVPGSRAHLQPAHLTLRAWPSLLRNSHATHLELCFWLGAELMKGKKKRKKKKQKPK